MAKRLTRALRVDTSNPWDKAVAELVAKGFYIKTIARLTGLTESQVSYRTHSFGLSPIAYRRGEGTEAARALEPLQRLIREGKNELLRQMAAVRNILKREAV